MAGKEDKKAKKEQKKQEKAEKKAEKEQEKKEKKAQKAAAAKEKKAKKTAADKAKKAKKAEAAKKKKAKNSKKDAAAKEKKAKKAAAAKEKKAKKAAKVAAAKAKKQKKQNGEAMPDEALDVEEEAGSKKRSKFVLIIPALALVGAASIAIIIWRLNLLPQFGPFGPRLSSVEPVVADGPDADLIRRSDPTGSPGEAIPVHASEPAGPAGPPEPANEPDPSTTPVTVTTPVRRSSESGQEMTTADSLRYVMNLQPQVLNLEGDDMSRYEVHTTGVVVSVNGEPCTQLSVYAENPKSGTNEIAGEYFLSRGAERKLYRLDKETGQVTQLPLTGGVGNN